MSDDGTLARQTRRDAARTFWLRLTDNLFRRLWLFAIPVLLLTGIGIMQSSESAPTFLSSGVLSASSNPYVADQEIRGNSGGNWWETPAAATARVINEQLRSDSFTAEVADRAGLTGAIDAGFVTLDVVRTNIWASANGSSLLTVSASWNDPETSFALVRSAIDTYFDHLAETVASDSSQAEEYYQNLLQEARDDVAIAEQEYTDFVDTLPVLDDGDMRPIEDELQVERMSKRLEAAEAKVDGIQELIDAAVLEARLSRSEAGRLLQEVDEPTVSSTPQSSLPSGVITLASYAVFGLIVAAAAVLVTTMLDRSVTVPSQIATIPGVSLVATIAPVARGGRGRRRLRSKGRNRTPGTDADPSRDGPGGLADHESAPNEVRV